MKTHVCSISVILHVFCLFSEEDSQPDASSITLVLMGTLAQDLDQAANEGVGSLDTPH